MHILRSWLSGRGLLVLLVLLVAVNGLYGIVAAQQSIVSGAPGDLLYAAGFDGFLDEWQQSAGREHQIVEGVMRVSVEDSNTIYAAANPLYTDFDASVTFRTVAGSEENEGVGLIFRLQEQGCDMPLPLLCDLNQINALSIPLRLLFRPQEAQQGYYIFLVSNDGYYALGKYDQQLKGLDLVTVWHNSDGLVNTGLNVDNRVRVVGRGDQFQFFINGRAVELCVPNSGERPTGNAASCQGQRVSVWQDSSYPMGKLGVVVHTDQNVGTVAEFDAFTVTMPRNGTETPGAEI